MPAEPLCGRGKACSTKKCNGNAGIARPFKQVEDLADCFQATGPGIPSSASLLRGRLQGRMALEGAGGLRLLATSGHQPGFLCWFHSPAPIASWCPRSGHGPAAAPLPAPWVRCSPGHTLWPRRPLGGAPLPQPSLARSGCGAALARVPAARAQRIRGPRLNGRAPPERQLAEVGPPTP